MQLLMLSASPDAADVERIPVDDTGIAGGGSAVLWASARSPLWRRRGPGSGSAPGGLGGAVEGAWPGAGPAGLGGEGRWPGAGVAGLAPGVIGVRA